MMDSNEMKKGGFAASAELQRQRQEAREAKDRETSAPASAAELAPVPLRTPTVNGGVPASKPLPAEETNVPTSDTTPPPLTLRTVE